ncbi:MAG TPA: glutamate--tRNA ligase family protein, partial [Mycobacteriales bacterium]|nr:glutamate--tRNA ligase family protein [Mycobacteriales bacterium]
KHLLLYLWLGWPLPQFAHMPLLRNADKSKISKRKNPAARLTWFVDEGFLPEALRNFLALMGYSLPDGREVFSFEEMVESFDWSRVNAVGPVFDVDKLRWLSGHYMRELPVEDIAERIVATMGATGEQADLVRRATPLVTERVTTLREAADMLQFLVEDDADFSVDPDSAAKQLGPEQLPTVQAARTTLVALESFTAAGIEAALREALVDGLGLKPRLAFGPVRVAVTGRTVSPPLFESIELLGRERTLARLDAALG